jgi:hypothetical protein
MVRGQAGQDGRAAVVMSAPDPAYRVVTCYGEKGTTVPFEELTREQLIEALTAGTAAFAVVRHDEPAGFLRVWDWEDLHHLRQDGEPGLDESALDRLFGPEGEGPAS